MMLLEELIFYSLIINIYFPFLLSLALPQGSREFPVHFYVRDSRYRATTRRKRKKSSTNGIACLASIIILEVTRQPSFHSATARLIRSLPAWESTQRLEDLILSVFDSRS